MLLSLCEGLIFGVRKMKKTLTKAVVVCILILLSGCSLLPSSMMGSTGQKVAESQKICSVPTFVILKTSLLVNNEVEKAIVDSGCFAIGGKKSSTLKYVVEENVTTKTKSYFEPGKIDGVFSAAGYLMKSAATGSTNGYRVTLKFDNAQGIGEVTSIKFVTDSNEAVYKATKVAVKNLVLSIDERK